MCVREREGEREKARAWSMEQVNSTGVQLAFDVNGGVAAAFEDAPDHKRRAQRLSVG